MAKRTSGIIDPALPLAIADRVIAKRWPAMDRRSFLAAYSTGRISQGGVAGDVAGILLFWEPLAARGPLPLGEDGVPREP